MSVELDQRPGLASRGDPTSLGLLIERVFSLGCDSSFILAHGEDRPALRRLLKTDLPPVVGVSRLGLFSPARSSALLELCD